MRCLWLVAHPGGHRPDVRVLGGVVIALVVAAEHGPRHDPHVLGLRRRAALFLLRDLLGRSGVDEGDRLPIRGPHGWGGALGDVAELHRLAPRHRKQKQLRTVVPDGAEQGERPRIRRPARRAVMRPRREAPRRRGAVRGDGPYARLVAIVLRVHGDEDVRHLLPVGRDLRTRHPAEGEEVSVADGPLLRREPGVSAAQQHGCQGETSHGRQTAPRAAP